MLDSYRVGPALLVALTLLSCSSNESSDGEEASSGADTGTQTATSGMGASNATTATTGTQTSANTGAGSNSTTGAGDTGGAGGSGSGPSTTGGPGNNGFGFGSGSGFGSGGSGGGDETSSTTASSTGAGGCTPAVECEPEPLPSTGDPHQDCVDRVNQFRVGCWCLPALERWTEGEACANQHAQYDSELDEAHAGFSDGICDNGGNAQNECPGWRSETQIIEGCLQMMYDEGPPPSQQCSGQCFQDHGHFINMTNERYTRVACGFYTTPGGQVWSVQNFR